MRPRLGVIGSGNIARRLVDHAVGTSVFELAFVHARNRSRLEIADEIWLESLDDLGARRPDLVVEAAHPVYVERWGEAILEQASFLPLSVSALADDALRKTLLDVARGGGHTLYLSRGALVGLDALSTAEWDLVSVEFVKNPQHIDFDAVPHLRDLPAGRSVVYEGPARGIAGLFPRNVNAMVVLALATVGLDALHCRLVADTELDEAELHIDARRADGHRIAVSKFEPMLGVSGEYLFAALLQGIGRAVPGSAALQFV
jgi:aspartate dehydrogenase